MTANVSLALVHHPVIDKNGRTIAAAVTSLDLHDIARSAKTFGIGPFFVVTPLTDQQELVRQIIGHWVTGAGAEYNPDRQDALTLIRLEPSLDEVRQALARQHGAVPKTIVTSARTANSDLSFSGLKDMVRSGEPLLLVFGTAWGLAPQVMDEADYRLAPIMGTGGYNHLAVRSAVAIVLDRITQ